MRTKAGTMHRLPVKGLDGSIDLIEVDGIFYLEAPGGRSMPQGGRLLRGEVSGFPRLGKK